MPICANCGAYTVRFPCGNCGSEKKGTLAPKELNDQSLKNEIEKIYTAKEETPKKPETSNVSTSLQVSALPNMPLPPVPSVDQGSMKETNIDSLYLERRGLLFYPDLETLEKFTQHPWAQKEGSKLRIIFEPVQKLSTGRIEINLLLEPVLWPLASPTPVFSIPEDEIIKFPLTEFWFVINSSNYSFTPTQISELAKKVIHPYLKVLIIDDRVGIHMNLDIKAESNVFPWTELAEEALSWFIGALIGRLLVKMKLTFQQIIAPFSIPAASSNSPLTSKDFLIFSDAQICR